MPPTDGDKAFRWRLEDSYRTVTGEAFAKLVHENGLEVKGPFGGYYYAMKHTTEGEELYRTQGAMWDCIPVTAAASEDAAAGANYATITVPAGKTWLFLGLRMSLVTDANAANRYMLVRFSRDGTNCSQEIVDSTAIAASKTAFVSFGPIMTSTTLVTASAVIHRSNAMDAVELPPGSTISVLIMDKQAGDNAGIMYYDYKEKMT